MGFIQAAILGIGAGAVYVLIAQGIVLIYRGSGTLNFAQGAVAMLTAHLFFEFRDHSGWATPLAFAAAVMLAGAFGVAVYLLILRPLRRSSALVRLVATLGLLTFLMGFAQWVWGESRAVQGILPTHPVRIGDSLVFPSNRLYLLVICIVITAVLAAVYQRTRFGLATAGASENELVAITLGWSPALLGAVNWFVGCALAGGAGILLTSVTGLSIRALAMTVVPGMATALVGRFSSFGWTLVGGLGIGVAQSLAVRYINEPGMADVVTFSVITVLVVLGGRAVPLRGEFLERPVRVGSGRFPRTAIAAVVAAAFLVVLAASNEWLLALSTSAGVGIVCLSFVLITGYAGQISLAQLTLAGIGAWIAGIASHYWSWPMPLAVVAGVVATVVVGTLTGLPALRVRGLDLAVVTLGVSVVIEGAVLANRRWQGRGLNGLTVETPSLFGLDVSFTAHPERYTALLFAAFMLCALAVVNIRRSQAGRELLALRSNERAAASLGISVMGGKLFAFATGAAFAGLGGALLTFQFTSAKLGRYNTMGSIGVLINTVLGGMGYVFGAIQGGVSTAPGGVIAFLLNRVGLGDVERLHVLTAVLLLAMLLVQPDGVAAKLSHDLDRIRTRRRARSIDAVMAAGEHGSPRRVPDTDALVVEGVTVAFGGVRALDDVSISVAPGQVLGIIGPNGAGKTTLIDAMCGFVPAESGRVTLGDTALEGLAAHARARRGLARTFQSVELFDDMSVLENIQVAAAGRGNGRFGLAYLKDMVFPRQRPLPAVARAAIRDLGLADHLGSTPGELPTGLQRLAGIARALSSEPSVICLDEPAAGLGDVEAAELAEVVRYIATEWNLAVLLIEHNVEFVRSVSDSVVALDLGRVIASGPPDDVLSSAVVRTAYLGIASDDDELVEETRVGDVAAGARSGR